MSIATNDDSQALSSLKRPDFLPWRVNKWVWTLENGNTQHIALLLAHKTPRNGERHIEQKELAAISHRSPATIKAALEELVQLGFLLKAKRTMGGFRIVWSMKGYGLTTGDDVSRHGQISVSVPDAAMRDALRRTLVPCYLSKLHNKYGIRPDSPEAQKRIGLSETQREEIVANLAYGAASLKLTAESITERVLLKWFESDGHNGGDFLKRTRHPLARLADDVGLLVCNAISFEEHKQRRGLTEQTHTVHRVEHYASLRPDVRQTNIEGGAALLSAMGVKRPMQRLDFKAAANG